MSTRPFWWSVDDHDVGKIANTFIVLYMLILYTCSCGFVGLLKSGVRGGVPVEATRFRLDFFMTVDTAEYACRRKQGRYWVLNYQLVYV